MFQYDEAGRTTSSARTLAAGGQSFGQKFADFTSTSTAINSADNAGGVTESLFQLSSPGGLNAPNLAGLVPNLWTTSAEQAGWFSIPLNWVTPMFTGTQAFAGAGFAAAFRSAATSRFPIQGGWRGSRSRGTRLG